jgi:hypothetical protein
VQFFFYHQTRAFAVVSTFSDPDNELLQNSYQTLYVCKYQGDQVLQVIEVDSICSVVAMVPFDPEPEQDTISHIGQRYFMVEKSGPDTDHTRGDQEETDVE